MTDDIDRHVRHLVGIATLRRLRRMIDSDAAQEASSSHQAKWLAAGLSIAAAVFILVLALNTFPGP